MNTSNAEFMLQFHVKNRSGAWQIRPFDIRLAMLAVEEANKLRAAGEIVVVIDAESTGMTRHWLAKR